MLGAVWVALPGRRRALRGAAGVLLFVSGMAVPLAAQTASPLGCRAAAVPLLVRLEGISERLGDVILDCAGGTPGGRVTFNLTLFLSVNITNKLRNDTLDMALTADFGSGPAPLAVPAALLSPSAAVFQNISFTLPADGKVALRLANLRGAASAANEVPISLFLATNGPSSIRIENSPLIVGVPARGLLASYSSTFVCRLSRLPESISFRNLVTAGTVFVSTRFTEGFAAAFQKRGLNEDSGTRFVVRYSGFPRGARLFVPDMIAGSNALRPTAGGDLGGEPSAGAYAPAPHGALLLARVRWHDAQGAGGAVAVLPPADPTHFDAVGEVDLINGSATVVYEVLDSNPAVRETAQFPTFLGFGPADLTPVSASMSISYGPTVLTGTASATAPVPRFAALAPPPDCVALGDCGLYFPRLRIQTQPLEFTAFAGQAFLTRHVFIYNDGGGMLQWVASVAYRHGSGWVRLDPPAGSGGMRLDVLPERLAPGVYEATLTIDGGPIAGRQSFPITLRVTPPPPSPPAVDRVVNAASFAATALVPGSLGTILGARFDGAEVVVTLDGVRATILFRSDRQINFLVPEELAGRASAQLLVIADGRRSATAAVPLAAAAPAIFPGAVLNQDFSVNTAANPAPRGTVIQIFATGLPRWGAISGRLHDRDLSDPDYGGPAPGLPGVQQVNLRVPEDLPAMTTEVRVCGADGASRICSPPATLVLQ